MAKASELLKIAIAELGYCEKKTNSQLDDKTANVGSNNWTKYARDLHTAGYYQAPKNGYAWCDMFVDWVCLQLMGSKEKGEWLECQTGLYGAGCEWSSNCYRKAGRFGTEPKVGAQIFFGKTGEESHTGIVEKFDDTYVYTIEGNTSNKVARRTYKRTDNYIVGYGYMRFDEEDKEEVVVPAKKSNEQLAKEVIAGKWGNGDTRKQKLTAAGYSYREVQNLVNQMLKPSQPARKTNEQLAKEVIAGKWGNGNTRKQKLTAAGYSYREVQDLVNKMLLG